MQPTDYIGLDVHKRKFIYYMNQALAGDKPQNKFLEWQGIQISGPKGERRSVI